MENLYRILKSVDFYKKVVIRDLLCVEYKCSDQRKYFDFWTDCDCLVFCTSGKKIYSSNADDFEVKRGSVFYMKKGAYTGKNYLNEQYCALMFFLPNNYFNEFLTKYPQLNITTTKKIEIKNNGIIPIEMESTLETFFYSILNYFNQVPQYRKEFLELKLEELTLSIFTLPEYRNLATMISTVRKERTTDIKQILEENFASNMKLEEYAELCNMSLSTFKREFLKIFNEPPGSWILNRKLQLSKNLLLHSEKNINEIAFQCGFKSTSHFIRAFKKEFNSTPLKHREKILNHLA